MESFGEDMGRFSRRHKTLPHFQSPIIKTKRSGLGGFLDELKKLVSTPSSITIEQQNQAMNPYGNVAPTETFFVRNSGLVITSVVAIAIAGTVAVMHFKNRNKS